MTIKTYSYTIVKNAILAVITGVICGIIGGIFHRAVDIATDLRVGNPIFILFLPLAGLLLAFLYKAGGLKKDPGTNCVLKSVRGEDKVPVIMAPLIFAATVITHMFGGSAGREGAALQLGGSLGTGIAKILKLDSKTTPIIILSGMSGVFSALFGTPLTATIFCIEVCCVGALFHSSILPCLIAAVTAAKLSGLFGNHPVTFEIASIPNFTTTAFLQILGVSVACGILAIIFCKIMHGTHKLADTKIKNGYIRIFTGGAIIVILTYIFRTTDYNGAGMDIITNAINGNAIPYAFALKILFTAITIGFGFKGGEIVPTFFIGATFGCVVAPLLGLDASFGAAIGIIALFSAVVNCPLASIALAAELYGGQGLLLFATAAVTSFIVSGYCGLYKEQKFCHSKAQFEVLNIKTK